MQRGRVIPKVSWWIQGRGRKKRTHPLIPKATTTFSQSLSGAGIPVLWVV